jgi:hypothetical protein
MRKLCDPLAAARHAEAAARAFYEREKRINEVIERRNPQLPATAKYQEGVLSSFLPMFPTTEAYYRYLGYRAMGRFDDKVLYPTKSAPSVPLGRKP